MKSQIRSWMMVILASAVAGAFLLWIVQVIWHTAGEIDRNPSRSGIKDQLMRRKAEAMHDILDETLEGNLGRVHSAAKRMERYGETIDGSLVGDLYDKHSTEFRQAVDDLINATAQEDVNNSKEAALRLERRALSATCYSMLVELSANS